MLLRKTKKYIYIYINVKIEENWHLPSFQWPYKEVSWNGGTQQPWVFLLKMIILGWRLGVPPFKETPISSSTPLTAEDSRPFASTFPSFFPSLWAAPGRIFSYPGFHGLISPFCWGKPSLGIHRSWSFFQTSHILVWCIARWSRSTVGTIPPNCVQ